jgi:hypothetical protein
MTEILREILDSWADSWRHPNLASLLARVGQPSFDDGEATDALVADIAIPRGPRETVAMLIKIGEFRLADDLLARGESQTGLTDGDLGYLRDQLVEARRRARDEVCTRVVSLKGRASRVGVATPPPPGLDEAVDDRKANAEVLLDGWESSIQRAEAELSQGLRALLGREAPPPGSTEPDPSFWRDSVERCIEAREFDTARFLLEGSPNASSREEPLAIPRRPPWPWNEPLRVALGWFQGRPAPADFASRWRPASEDAEAHTLILSLQEVVARGIPDAACAVQFATALDAFLGPAGERDRPADRRGDGFETRLYASADPRLPCLAPSDDTGVRLWLPLSPAARPPEVEPGEKLLLCFFPEHPATRRGTLAFDARVLLRLMADRNNRRLNFLRELGGRVNLEDVVPADLATVKPPPRGGVRCERTRAGCSTS